MTLNDLEPRKIGGISEYYAISGCYLVIFIRQVAELFSVRFLLLSTILAWRRLHIDTDFLFIIISSVVLTSFPVVPTSMTLNDLEIQNSGVLVNFSRF